MTIIAHNNDTNYIVVHPINDVAEEKRDGANLEKMHLSRSVKTSLIILRGYLICMFLLVGYYILKLAGVIGHHIAH